MRVLTFMYNTSCIVPILTINTPEAAYCLCSDKLNRTVAVKAVPEIIIEVSKAQYVAGRTNEIRSVRFIQ